MFLLSLAPTQRLDEHHGIVMDWARWGVTLFEKPV
jgi:hypothetical protein